MTDMNYTVGRIEQLTTKPCYDEVANGFLGNNFESGSAKSLSTKFQATSDKKLMGDKEYVMPLYRTESGLLSSVPTTKPSNPKDVIGSDKLPLHLWPQTATAMGSLAMLEGALKYGRSNFRAVGVKSSIYYDALMRHMTKWFEGQDIDPDSGLPELGKALACIAILIDAQAAGKLNDDRMVKGGYAKLVDEMTSHVKRLKEQYKDMAPKHYTIEDEV